MIVVFLEKIDVQSLCAQHDEASTMIDANANELPHVHVGANDISNKFPLLDSISRAHLHIFCKHFIFKCQI